MNSPVHFNPFSTHRPSSPIARARMSSPQPAKYSACPLGNVAKPRARTLGNLAHTHPRSSRFALSLSSPKQNSPPPAAPNPARKKGGDPPWNVKCTKDFALFARTDEIYQQNRTFFKGAPTNPNKINPNREALLDPEPGTSETLDPPPHPLLYYPPRSQGQAP